jgi:molecular chaperone GrpE
MPENKEHKNEEKLELENKTDELAEMKDKYLRALAELENTRRRTNTDMESAAQNRAIMIAGQFLPLIDAIDKAFEHAPKDDGIKTLKKAADNTLAKLGIIRIETTGQPLNPQFHNVIMAEESDKPVNEVIKEMQAGFMFGDSVLRTALVVVAKPKEKKE